MASKKKPSARTTKPKPASATSAAVPPGAPVPPDGAPNATNANVAAHGGGKAGGKGKSGKKAATGGKAVLVGKPAAPKPPRRPSLLGLAADVLAASKEPMTSGAIVEKVLAEKLWVTAGKTPAATLYAAMIREIKAKGTDARFVKTERGLFAASKANAGKR